jgi:hypothetical protein
MPGTRTFVRHYVQPLFALVAIVLLNDAALGGFDQFSVGGTTLASSIQTTVDNFRAALGNPNNLNAPGPVAGGRREINWDGGGAVVSAAAGTPFTGFQNTRGATFLTPGTGFLQTPLNDAAFTAINATYATTFSRFSDLRIFTPLGSNITDVTFSVPGSGGLTPATVSGFGAVFSDVDVANLTSMQFFDDNGVAIQTFPVPVQSPNNTAPAGGLSFFGAIANAGERISRVRITTGNSALGPNDQNGDNIDVVVMDDFLYDEPQIPEPATFLLATLGLLGASLHRRSSKV